MYRHFYHELEDWEKGGAKKPLLVIGARQVGKTYLIDKFCSDNYDDYFHINLESQPEYISAFEGSLMPDAILKTMEQLAGRRLTEKTAIFIDEIQQSEKAVTSLKYFCEAKTPYRIIGAGSLLGVKLNRFESSFPVGKVYMKNMYPMDFFEFLLASNEAPLKDGIEDSFKRRKALPEGVHKKALSLYHDYLYVGGMPEAVNIYASNNKDPLAVEKSFYENLRMAYLSDMTRYTISPAEGVKITEVYESIPSQLAGKNPKFKYKEIRPYANKRDFSSSLDWLVSSGLVLRVKKVDSNRTPLKGYESESGDRIYLSDVGILSHNAGLMMRDISSGTENIYKGAVTENFFMQQAASNGKVLYYYKPHESMEIDFLTEIDGEIVPVEIKSGRPKRSTSLKNYMEKYSPALSIRVSEHNFGYGDWLFSVPLYASGCIK